jgi:hypothetical protein
LLEQLQGSLVVTALLLLLLLLLPPASLCRLLAVRSLTMLLPVGWRCVSLLLLLLRG